MELTVTGSFVKQILEATPANAKLKDTLASQLISAVDPHAMAAYLLTKDAAVSLLSERLKKEPVKTMTALQDLPKRANGKPEPAKKSRKKVEAKTAPKPRRKAKSNGKRRRLSGEEVSDLKEQVRSFLKTNGWSTRKELTSAVDLNTQAIYRRILSELQEEGAVIAQGEKSKAVYGLNT